MGQLGTTKSIFHGTLLAIIFLTWSFGTETSKNNLSEVQDSKPAQEMQSSKPKNV